jgi:predicted transcriptional regulator
VTRLFQSKGYYARHNARLTGISGVEHQIDVYAEYRAPLHTSKIIIECKHYDQPVNKDIVMNLINEVRDLGVDRGILVTTSYFTPDAVSTAKHYPMDLWDGNKLRELLNEIQASREIEVPANFYLVHPRLSEDRDRAIMEKRLKGFFGRKGVVKQCTTIYYPFYQAEVKGKIRLKKKEKIAEGVILVDALFRGICFFDKKKGIECIHIPKLSREEAETLEVLIEQGWLTTTAIAALLGYSTAKTRRVLQGLVAKKVVEEETWANRRKEYSPGSYDRNYDISRLLKEIPRTIIPGVKKPESMEGLKTLKPKISYGDVEDIVTLLWKGKAENIRMIYYPIYACIIIEQKGESVKTIDLVTGKENKKLGEQLTTIYEELPL